MHSFIKESYKNYLILPVLLFWGFILFLPFQVQAIDWSWTSVTAPGGDPWYSVTSSSDGTHLAGVAVNGDIWTSTTTGATWTNETTGTPASGQVWVSITSSSDGTHLAAVAQGGDIWTSTNSGVTWTNETTGTPASGQTWNSITSSSDGTHLAAVAYGGDIWTSTTTGATWTNETTGDPASGQAWDSITSSSDGTHLAAVAYGGDIWTSANSGVTWTDRTSSGSRNWSSITSSSDGTHLAAPVYFGDIYTSTDSGATWTDQTGSGSKEWNTITSSSDGTHLAAAVYRGDIYTSSDSGLIWEEQTDAPNTDTKSASTLEWSSIASSATGCNLVAVSQYGWLSVGSQPSPCLGDPIPPTVTTDAATSVTASTTTLNGDLTQIGISTTTPVTEEGFIYGPNELYGATTTATSSGFATGDYGAPITGLACNATYYFEAYATNSAGTGYGPEETFTTSSCGADTPPAVSTNSPSSIGPNSLNLNGDLVSTGSDLVTEEGFIYGSDTTYGATSSADSSSFSEGPYTQEVSGLACNATYHYEAYAISVDGTVYSPDETFTTATCGAGTAPTVSTNSASSLSANTANLNADLISTGSDPTTVEGFIYGPDTTYGATTTAATSTNLAAGDYSAPITGLACNATYHYEAYATNSDGTAYGPDETFTTSSCGADTPPVVSTASPSSISLFSANLNGFLISTGSDLVTAQGFVYGPDTGYGATTTATSTSFSDGAFSQNISVACNTTYHYKAYATNVDGTVYGNDESFNISGIGGGGCGPLTWTWTNATAGKDIAPQVENTGWSYIASSADGTHLVAVQSEGDIWTSSDSGATWTDRTIGTAAYNIQADGAEWSGVASSADGTHLSAVSINGDIWSSNDSGVTWTNDTTGTSASGLDWSSITSSSDGTRLFAGTGDGSPDLWTSTNYGATWTAVPPSGAGAWLALASSADGSHLAGLETYDGIIEISSNYGVSWNFDPGAESYNQQDWRAITMSADGTHLAAVTLNDQGGGFGSEGDIWTSDNSGASWTNETTGTPASGNDWESITSSANGMDLAATAGYPDPGDVWTSTDYGATWTDQGAGISANYTGAITSSSDGTHLAVVDPQGDIWTSTDAGVDWTDNPVYSEGVSNWESVATSANGVHIAAVASDNDIWTSSDSGAIWTNDTINTPASGQQWVSITSSADGTHLAAAAEDQDIWTSSDSGATWTNETTGTPASGQNWLSITSSSDGTHLAAVADDGDIWTSSDSGATWTNETTGTPASGQAWVSITSSSDGTHLTAAAQTGDIWTSSDSGATWTNETTGTPASGQAWTGVTSSSDGIDLAALAYGGDIWTSTTTGATWTNETTGTSASGLNWENITSSSDGTNLAAVEWGGDIWTSSDSGVTWTNQTIEIPAMTDQDWDSDAFSANACKLDATIYGGDIYVGTNGSPMCGGPTEPPAPVSVSQQGTDEQSVLTPKVVTPPVTSTSVVTSSNNQSTEGHSSPVPVAAAASEPAPAAVVSPSPVVTSPSPEISHSSAPASSGLTQPSLGRLFLLIFNSAQYLGNVVLSPHSSPNYAALLPALGALFGATGILWNIFSGGRTLADGRPFYWPFLYTRKKGRPWGTVYDSITKRGLDPAVVTLYDSSGKELKTAITDMDGRFGFLVEPGTYSIIAQKGHHTFPAAKVPAVDPVYSLPYRGGPFTVGEEGVAIRDIPLDPVEFDWNEYEKYKHGMYKFMSRFDRPLAYLSLILTPLGALVSIAEVIIEPNWLNIIFVLLYVVIGYLYLIGYGPRLYGAVRDALGNPLQFAVVRAFQPGAQSSTLHAVTDHLGRYYLLLPKGNEFDIQVEGKNGEEYTTLLRKHFSNLKGHFNKNLTV